MNKSEKKEIRKCIVTFVERMESREVTSHYTIIERRYFENKYRDNYSYIDLQSQFISLNNLSCN